MKYLLDTQVAIWALGEKSRLSSTAKAIIDDGSVPLYISIISAWEIAIKISIGKLEFSGGSGYFIEKMLQNGIAILGVEASHIEVVETLPFLHRDPFDRLLIATAKADSMTIITSDENIRKYDIQAIW